MSTQVVVVTEPSVVVGEVVSTEIIEVGMSGPQGPPGETGPPGAGSTINVQESDGTVVTDVSTLDFLGTDFDLTDSPAGEANIAIAPGHAGGSHATFQAAAEATAAAALAAHISALDPHSVYLTAAEGNAAYDALGAAAAVAAAASAADAVHTADTTAIHGITDTAQLALLNAANVFTTGTQEIRAGAAGTKALLLKGAAAQTASLLELQSSAAAVLAQVLPDGGVLAKGHSAFGPAAAQNPVEPIYNGFAVNAIIAAIDTASEYELGDLGGLDSINAGIVSSLRDQTPAASFAKVTGGLFAVANYGETHGGTNGITVQVDRRGAPVTGGNVILLDMLGTIFDGVTADATTRDVIGVLSEVDLTGSAGAGRLIGAVVGADMFDASTANVAYGLWAYASTQAVESYSLVLNASGTATAWIARNTNPTTPAGGIAFGSSRDTNLYRSAADTLKTDDSLHVAALAGLGTAPVTAQQLTVLAAAAANKVLVAKGAAAQSGNLAEFQSSAAAVLASVAADGAIRSTVALGTKHEGASTPTGGSSGDVRVGTDTIWVNDAGTWKSAEVLA